MTAKLGEDEVAMLRRVLTDAPRPNPAAGPEWITTYTDWYFATRIPALDATVFNVPMPPALETLCTDLMEDAQRNAAVTNWKPEEFMAGRAALAIRELVTSLQRSQASSETARRALGEAVTRRDAEIRELRAIIKDAAEALTRESTSAPVLEVLKRAAQ